MFIVNKIINDISKKGNKDDKNNIENNIKFKLPIAYLKDKYKINENIKTDLELFDISNSLYTNKSLYENIVSSEKNKSTKLLNQWSEYYTTNIDFLENYQIFFKKYKPISDNIVDVNVIENILDEVNSETNFYEKYKYIDIDFLKNWNRSPIVLQTLTLYNLTSPILSLVIPVIMMIMPFFILKIQRIPITLEVYFSILIKLLKNHILGQLFSKFSQADITQKFFLIFSLAFYIISIYQNINSCITFYKNIYKIQKYLTDINKFIELSIKNINNVNNYSQDCFSNFIEVNNNVKLNLEMFKLDINRINLENLKITHVNKIGDILKCFYELYENNIYKNSLKYCIDLYYYLINIENIQKNIVNKKLNFCNYSNKKTKFSGAYFVSLINKSAIRNSYNLDKQILITGPNAAGKTTLLKTTLFNIIISQQIGVGCYKKANINVYKYIYSYINIPDTSQRDSLFQAEARRCKEILVSLCNSKDEDRHFCIFDEIYSGTNPSEAIASAYSFLNYIAKYKNFDYILTTHYNTLCELLEENIKIINKHMVVKDNKNTYKLDNGISNIKGGIKVLKDLEYDKVIIDQANKLINQINVK